MPRIPRHGSGLRARLSSALVLALVLLVYRT
jgi:hypothetical protein